MFWLSMPITWCSYAANEITDFVHSATGKTYDCPKQSVIDQVEEFLSLDELSVEQLRGLESLKSHHLICLGDYEQARKMITLVIDSEEVDKDAHYYAMAHYQLGFIYDVQGNPKKCEQYQLAERFGEGKFDDIYLSARLGQITECTDKDKDIGVNLGKLYSLLDIYITKGDRASVAHIHNNIGLLYGGIGQSALAAEQYEKAYRIGLEVYEPKNQVAPLMSVISASIAVGDHKKAMEMIEELGKARVKLKTPLINNWYYYSLVRYFYTQDDMLAVKSSLSNWQRHINQVSSRSLKELFDWYTAVVCLYEKDAECVTNYITKKESQDNAYRSIISTNREYLRFLVEAHFFLGDVDKTERLFQRYADTLHTQIKGSQASARVLGVAQLHNNILLLEADLQAAETKRLVSMIVIVAAGGVALTLLYFFGLRPYLRRLTRDPLTGLLNEQSVIQQIKTVKVPSSGRVNALAMFDLAKFIEANAQFSFMQSDALLKQIARCLQDVTREQDIAGRLSDNQFLVCLKNIEEHKANELFGRIQNALASIAGKIENGQNVDVSSSVHVYSSLTDLSDVDTVLSEISLVLSRA